MSMSLGIGLGIDVTRGGDLGWWQSGSALDLDFANSLGFNSIDRTKTTLDSILTYTNPSAKMVYGSDGVLRYAPHNLLLQSQSFETASWAFNSTISANDGVAPDGTLTAVLLTPTANDQNASQLLTGLQQINGVTYTFSVWMRAETAHTATLRMFEGAFAAEDARVDVNVTTEWQRFSLTTTWAVSGTSIRVLLFPKQYGSGNPNLGVYIWGAQLNLGSSTLTYIPTTTAAKYSLPIDHNPTTFEPLGVLIEEQRTNLCLYSDDFTNAAWTPTNLTTAKTATGPDGVTNSASTLTATAANATARQNVTSASAARITSMFVKRRTGTGAVYLSQGGTTGSELFVNGTFTTDTTGWTAFGATLAVVSSELELTNTGASSGYADSDVFPTVVGTAYLVGYTARRGSSSSIDIQVRKTTGGAETSVTLTNASNVDGFLYFIASTTSTFIRVSANQAVVGRTGYFDNLSVKAAVETTVTVTSDWTRVATASATVTNPPLIIRMATSGDAIDVDLFQHELGAFITSPIPTVASQVTRLLDQVSILTSAFGYSATAGTVVSEQDTIFETTTVNGIAYFYGGSSDNAISIHTYPNRSGIFIRSGGVLQCDLLSSSTQVNGVPFKQASAWAVNDAASTVNGAAVLTDTSVSLPTGITTLYIGCRLATSQNNGHIKRLTYFPTRKTNADLQVLST